jgi:hypothetical protein
LTLNIPNTKIEKKRNEPETATYFSQPNLETNETPNRSAMKRPLRETLSPGQTTEKAQNLQTLYGEDASHCAERISAMQG